MSYMLMDYFVSTLGDEYSDIESENSDDHVMRVRVSLMLGLALLRMLF